MKDVRLKDHVVVEYPQLGKYTILFREGGMQNFTLGFEDLPGRIQTYMQQCIAEGRFQTVTIPHTAGFTEEPQAMSGFDGMVIKTYSKAFPRKGGLHCGDNKK